jgi:transposase
MTCLERSYITGLDRRQLILFPDTLDAYVDEENPVRFIDAFVERLELKALGFDHCEPVEAGRPSYDPGDMLRLYIYGYLNQVRSSRRLERECHRNVEVMWLMKRLAPDFKTIADFRKDNVGCIKHVFKEFIYICKSLDLFGGELVGIDSSKFRAVNSRKRNLNRQTLKMNLKRVEERVEVYLRQLEENDRLDQDVEASAKA